MKQKKKKPALAKLLTALTICRENSYNLRPTLNFCFVRGTAEPYAWIVPMLVELFKQGNMQDYILKTLTEISPDTIESLTDEKQPVKSVSGHTEDIVTHTTIGTHTPSAPGLTVQFFGNFKVFIGNNKLDDSEWKSKKALMLFKFLSYFRSKGYIKKDILMELLWPNEDPRKTVNRFYVAMASLRKTLEPDLPKWETSSYIKSKDGSYRINIIDEKGFVDTENFLEKIKSAQRKKDHEQSIKYYLEAEALYKDKFLEEDLYVDWCSEEREWLKNQYLDLIIKIISHYENKKDFKKCTSYTEKYLNIEKYDEKIYQKLMGYHSLSGNTLMVQKIFKQCKYNMQNGLDCSVSTETEMLYDKLTSQTAVFINQKKKF